MAGATSSGDSLQLCLEPSQAMLLPLLFSITSLNTLNEVILMLTAHAIDMMMTFDKNRIKKTH